MRNREGEERRCEEQGEERRGGVRNRKGEEVRGIGREGRCEEQGGRGEEV